MLIVGSCSATKRHPVTLDATAISAPNLSAYARTWLGRIEGAPKVAKAASMYGGAAHIALTQAAELTDARLIFVSAGLGVLNADDRIPAYNLTVARGGPGPFSRASAPYEPAKWWAALHAGRGQPLAQRVRRHDGTVVLALPPAYLAMVEEDLSQLEGRQLAKLRIVATPGARLPERLKPQAIYYDSRLNSIDEGFAGGMASLVQRAAMHFTTRVLSDSRITTVDGERRRVDKILAAHVRQKRPPRREANDAQVRALVRKIVKAGARSVTAALSSLRHEHGVACEQRRFETIYEGVTGGRA